MWGIFIAAALVVALGFAIIYVPLAIYALFSTIAQGGPVFEGPGDVLVILPAIIIVGLIVGVPILFILYKKGILYSLSDIKIKKRGYSSIQYLFQQISPENTLWVLIGNDNICVYNRDSSTPSFTFDYDAQGFNAPDSDKKKRLASYIGRHCFGGHYILKNKNRNGYLYGSQSETDYKTYDDPLLAFRGEIVCNKKYKKELDEKLTAPKDPREDLF